MKNRRVKQYLLGILVCAAIVGFSSASQAQTADDGFNQSIKKIETVAETLAGLTALFTSVLITPMGISAAAQTFRHVVLRNV